MVRSESIRHFLLRHGHVFYRRHMKNTHWGRVIGQKILKSGLISATELQISALIQDSRATQESPNMRAAQASGQQEIICELPGFHLSPPLNFEVSEALALRPRINVLLPSLRLKHMSGGPNTALLLAALLAEGGESIRIIACDAPAEGEEAALFPHMDRLMQRPVVRARIELVDAFNRTQPTTIGANDLFLATAWWTAQMAKYAIEKTVCKTFIYLIQDFEPILHEGSTFQARAHETYSLQHIPVINTRLLLDYFVKQESGCYADPEFSSNALWFEPALDRNYYFPDAGEKKVKKKVLLFYARPTAARRNLFEIGVVALRRAVASGVIDKDNWEIWAMGENLPQVALGNDVFLNPLPWMSFDDYAKRVRTADLLLSLMLSPHPSYPPLEMAASGKLVVTNSFSVKTAERMRALSPNIIVANPTAESIGAALENAAGRINIGLPSFDSSGSIALPSSWDESLGEIMPELLKRINSLRITSSEADVSAVTGLPSNPKNEYERYRRDCLERRRDSHYQQESGLLCFITSAYNTAPAFLEELGSSVLLQDGGMHFDWLILDNGSTKEETRRALEKLASHPKVRLIRVETNLGIIGGMRFLLERASGRYILPLDSDDLIEPDCVNVLTRFIKDSNYPPLLYTDEDKLGNGRFGSPYFKPDWDPVLFLHSCYIAHLCAIDRRIAIELGLYTDSGAEGCHDWDSFIRFMCAGYVPRHIPEVLYSWRLHSESTSGNIASKSYITESHRNTLQRFLHFANVPNVKLVNSPLFSHNVDWWFRHNRGNPVSMQTITIVIRDDQKTASDNVTQVKSNYRLSYGSAIEEFSALVEQVDSDLLHIIWQDVVPDNDEWQWDAMALFELFGDAMMVGGILHDGAKVLDGPRVFGFGDGFSCPDIGRVLADPGYGAKMWKPHTVSSSLTAHCVIRVSFLRQCLAELVKDQVMIPMLGPWLGALAMQTGNRVVYSPFMRACAKMSYEEVASQHDRAHFLSRFWPMIPDWRVYSPRLGLELSSAYKSVVPEANRLHLLHLQKRLLPYSKWLKMHMLRRGNLYPMPQNPVSISLITTVYEGTDIGLLDELAESVVSQTKKADQWIIIAHGPIAAKVLEHMLSNAERRWRANIIVIPSPLGIMGAMHMGLNFSTGDYIVPVDADDVLTLDAIQILACAIDRFNKPDLIFSDEDMLVDSQPTSPYLRSKFDPVLNLDCSYIWHLCAINRARAAALGLYSDLGATWCHDWDSVMRVVNAGGRIEHVPEVLYHWRQHVGSTTNNLQSNSRSLDSVRHILERQIARTASPHHYYVSEWPKNRGAKELYIARRTENLPPFVWIGDAALGAVQCDDDAILAVAASGVLIDSEQVFVEVVRLLELHPSAAAVGGLVMDRNGLVVDCCHITNDVGMLESPWFGQPASHGGPYALALKTQSVASTGNSLAFFRISALRQIGVWPLEENSSSINFVMSLCRRLAVNNWRIIFSPLVQACAGSGFHRTVNKTQQSDGWPPLNSALVRYGISCNYQN